jgi:hypothetical protein
LQAVLNRFFQAVSKPRLDLSACENKLFLEVDLRTALKNQFLQVVASINCLEKTILEIKKNTRA